MADKMSKIEMLFVRACKSRNPYKRVSSVYRRFYWSGEVVDHIIVGLLADICQKHLEVKLYKVIERLDPIGFMRDSNESHTERAFKYCVSRLRLSEVARFPGYRTPCCFKSKSF